MTVRRPRPPLQRDPCMFERCRFHATRVTLDGRHELVLCETHAKGLRDALAQPGAFEIKWGLWPHEKRKLDEAQLTRLLFTYPDRPAEPDWWDDEAESEYFELRRVRRLGRDRRASTAPRR